MPELRRRVAPLVTAGLAVFLVVAVATAPDVSRDRAVAIGERIRCPVCQGESIAESPADLARDMMGLVRQRVEEGATDQQIIGELLSSYSGAVLLDPPFAGATLWLWLLPGAVAALGLVAAARMGAKTGYGPRATGHGPQATGDGPRATGEAIAQGRRGRRRTVVGAALLVGAMAATVALVAEARQDAGSPRLAGVAGGEIDLESVSNETLEAVIASNLDHPQINGMRLALAERYFEARRFDKAFVHYQAILESEPPPALAAIALTRLGWMVYEGNGEVELATTLLDRALEAAPGDSTALYLKAQVRWCGAGDHDEAARLLREVLAGGDLDAEETTQVETDLAALEAGDPCS
jgi:cytochrome c-type biogenesis protein CcmH